MHRLTQALRIIVVAGAAHVAELAGVVDEAVALAGVVARDRRAARGGAVAGLARRIVKVSGQAAIAARSTKAFATNTLSGFLIADFRLGALMIAVAVCRRRWHEYRE